MRITNELFRLSGALIAIAITAQALAETPDHPNGVSACLSFTADTTILSEPAKKSLDNMAKFIKRTPQSLQNVFVNYTYLAQSGDLYSYFSVAQTALAREQVIYRALSARVNKEIADVPVDLNVTAQSKPEPLYCEIGVYVMYMPREGDKYLCAPSFPDCIYIRCDEKGCSRQASK